jgi:hypothetical protein
MAKREYNNCKYCGATQSEIGGFTPEPGKFVVLVSPMGHHHISCHCGILTKLCLTKDDLKVLWNSSPKKRLKAPKVSVKHPKTKHVDPSIVPDDF